MSVRYTPSKIAGTFAHESRVVCYLSAGTLLHAITVIDLLTIVAISLVMDKYPLAYPAFMLMGLMALFTQMDARSRYQEYKKIRDQLAAFGPDGRIFRSLARSRCQRDAALAAARHLGYESDCRACFAAAGYRWYHLFPDFVKKHPGFLLSTAFWRATFFAPTYHTRYPMTNKNRDAFDHDSFCSASRIRNCS